MFFDHQMTGTCNDWEKEAQERTVRCTRNTIPQARQKSQGTKVSQLLTI